MRSGWSKLASSVAIPDELDPDIYGPVQQSQPNPSHAFPRPTPPSEPKPTLYKKEPEQIDLSRGFPRPQQISTPQPAGNEGPTLYRREDSKEVDLSKGFPRPQQPTSPPLPPPPMEPPKKEVTTLNQKDEQDQEVDLSKGFPRPQQPLSPPKQTTTLEPESPVVPPVVPSIEKVRQEESESTDIQSTVEEVGNKTPLQSDFKAKASSKVMIEVPKREMTDKLKSADQDYNSDDDIIPTRKRWVNPRPHRPYLVM